MLHLLLDGVLLLFQSCELEGSRLVIASIFMMHVSVNIISLLFILLVTLLSLIGRVGIIIASLLRYRDMALHILLSLHEAHVLAVTQRFFTI